jgi:hypothetical protein
MGEWHEDKGGLAWKWPLSLRDGLFRVALSQALRARLRSAVPPGQDSFYPK